MFKTELKITIRHMDSIFFGILFPVGMVLLLGVIYGKQLAFEGANYTKLQLAFGAFISIGIVATGLMGLPLVLADYRHRKILKRFKVTPVSPARILLIQMIISFLIAVVSAFATALVAMIFFGYVMLGSMLKFIFAFLLVTISIYSLGILIASVVPTVKMANLVCTLVYFPMIFLSGATVPYEIMPEALQKVSDIMPLTQGIKLLKGVSLGEPTNNFTFQFILMIGIAIICILGSLKFFKWE
jgi:ABC-2 type transport system permease protein